MTKGSGLTAWFLPDEVLLNIAGTPVRMRFQGAQRDARVEGLDALPGKANFLTGGANQWRLDVPLFGRVVYRQLYPGIDMVYGGNGRNLKSEFVVAPGADPSQIAVRYLGAGTVRINAGGALVIPLDGQPLLEEPPRIYQERDGKTEEVEGRFELAADGSVRFHVGPYDASLPLIVDPTLSYSTLLGGSGFDSAISIAVDSSGAAYLAGYTDSYDFPTANPAQSFNAGGNDAFVAKLNPAGNGLVYCTYVGGSGDDRAYGIAVDPNGYAYVTGSTASLNFPARYALQSQLQGWRNAFVFKLNPAGNVLVFSTYLGGNGFDTGYGIALDGAGNAYVTGDTTSVNFPATGFQKSYRGTQDAFVAKIAADGTRLLYSTYLGGGNSNHGAAIAVDAGGTAYIAGSTYSVDFPTLNAFQPNLAGGEDAFVARLSADGNSLLFSTYLGGSGGVTSYPETAQGIALDAQGSAYVTGVTSSPDFPLLHALQPARAGSLDAFVTKLNASGALMYSTYLGGYGVDVGNAIAVDSNGGAVVVGYTYSTDLPVVGAIQSQSGGDCDAFVAKLSPTGDSLVYLSYLGGNGSDTATAVALDPSSSVYVAGWTLSTNFPLLNPYQTVNSGNYGAYVTKIALGSAGVTSIWPASAVPGTAWHSDSSATLGVKFRSDTGGYIAGIRFYKGAGNNGTHIGLLYSAGGTLLAQATFTGETASGWQKVNFSTPVAISAGTTYIAAYFSTSGYPYDCSYFTGNGVDNAPLHALRSGVDGPNGVYAYGASPQFPAASYGDANYWADVVYSPSSGSGAPDLTIAVAHSGNFEQGQTGATYAITVANSGTAPTSGAITVTESVPTGLTATSMLGSGWVCTQPAGPCTRSDALAPSATFPTITVTVDVAGNAAAIVTNIATVGGGGETNTANDEGADPSTITSLSGGATSIWPASAVPGSAWRSDSSLTLGLKFRSDSGGSIAGIRFYKGAGNNGTHIGLLYSVSGSLLGQATFTGETASGWQQVTFSTPVAISANTTYIAAYFSTSGFAYDSSYFTSSGVDNAPLHALRSGVDGPNGVYAYGASPQFPAYSSADANYWADVVFAPSTGSSIPDLTIAKAHAGNFAQGQTGASYTVTVTNSGTASTSGTVTVTESLPTGLTATSMLGSGWVCTQPVGPCTRSDVLGVNATFPAITVTVNVATGAPASVINTATVAGGGETNTSNDQAADPTTITSLTGGATSIWTASAVPGTAWHSDSAATLGVKFRADTSGSIAGIRFYKGAGNNGTHIGLLYSTAGTLLAQATFTGETASGWQQVAFNTPVAISANTTYIAAYFSTSGFAYDSSYFTNNGADNAPLHAPRSGVDGPNGVYAYGASPQFPAYNYGDANYWVDIVF